MQNEYFVITLFLYNFGLKVEVWMSGLMFISIVFVFINMFET
ncbi:hypothetical protein LINPERPRIM_LOCUS30167 [Linum perenne]